MSRTTNKRPGKAKSGLSRKQKVAIYIRVSTLYQVDRDSLPMQRKDLIAYASLILGIEEYEIFEDAGYSGKNTDRPAFQEMMQRIRKGEFTHVLVWKIDRISRNLLDFAEMYEELLAANMASSSTYNATTTSRIWYIRLIFSCFMSLQILINRIRSTISINAVPVR